MGILYASCLFPVYPKFAFDDVAVRWLPCSLGKSVDMLIILRFEEGGHLIGGMSSGGLGQTDIGDTPYIGGLAIL